MKTVILFQLNYILFSISLRIIGWVKHWNCTNDKIKYKILNLPKLELHIYDLPVCSFINFSYFVFLLVKRENKLQTEERLLLCVLTDLKLFHYFLI